MSQVYRIDQSASDEGRPGRSAHHAATPSGQPAAGTGPRRRETVGNTIRCVIRRSRRQALVAVSAIGAVAILMLLNPAAAFAAACTLSAPSTWADGNSDWSIATNWSPNGAPNSSSANVCITDGTSTVTLDISPSIANLQIGSGNALNSSQTLTVDGTSISNAGSITNSGSIIIANGVTLSGAGTLTMSGGYLYESGGQTLTNQSTIQGYGTIGYNGLSLNNQATVNANASGQTLSLSSSSGITNGISSAAGTLEATGGGTLTISDAVQNQYGSIIATGTGSTVNVNTTIEGGTLTTASGGVMQTDSSATLDGSTLGAITLSNGSTYTAGGSTDVLGTINLGTSGSGSNIALSGNMILTGATTLTGPGTVTMAGGYIYESGGQTLTNQSTIQGYGTIGYNGLSLLNEATVNANVNGQTLSLSSSDGITNGTSSAAGTLEATGGGTLTISDTVQNQYGSIIASGTGSTVNVNTTIEGGTLTTASGGVMQTDSSATLDGSTLGAITLTNGSTYKAGGSTDVLGTINLGTSGSGSNIALSGNMILTGATTLTGPGTVTMAGGYIYESGGQTLTNQSTIQGYGTIGYNGLTVTNEATVNANASGQTLSLSSSDGITNGTSGTTLGTLEATGGGTLYLGNTVQNQYGSIIAGTGSTVNVNTTIEGGSLTTTGTGVMQTDSSATLDGSTLGAITLTNGSTYSAPGGTTYVLGTINLGTSGSGASIALGGTMTLNGNTTLSGPGALTMTGATIDEIGSQTLTNQSTIQGYGQIGYNGASLTNEGLVNANASGQTLLLSGVTTTTNGTSGTTLGTLEATGGGTLTIADAVQNQFGSIIAGTGSTVNVNSTIQGGTLTTTGTGVMQTDGSATLDGSSSQGAITLTNGSTYTAAGGTTYVLGTINLGTSGSGSNIALGGTMTLNANTTLAGPGTMTMTGGAVDESGAQTLTNQATIQGYGQIGYNGTALINQGLVNANAGGQALSLNGGGTVDNTAGTLEASNGGSLLVSNSLTAATYGGGTINGNYIVDGTSGKSTLQINALGTSGGEITTLGNGTTASSITLNGANTNTLFVDSAGKNALALSTVNTNASLTLEGGYAMTTPVALSNAGTVTLSNATLTDTSLTNTGLLSGNGTVSNTGGGAVSNSGQVTATAGKLVLSQGVTGTTGDITVSSGASLDISGASAGNTVGTLLLQHTGGLTIGSQNITVSSDYNNADFGSGNSFNNHANVTGSGSILAAGTGLSLTVSGTGITGGDTSTPTLALGNVHAGSGLGGTFDINWAGTNAPVLRGGVGSTSALTVSNPLFGPITPGGSTPETISVAPLAAGALSGQTLTVMPNFDNVQSQTIAVTGAAYNLANPVVTPSTVALGNFHVHDPVVQQGITIANQTISNAAYQEGLNASFGSVGSSITTNGGSINDLAAGSSDSSSLKVGVLTGSAGAINQTATIMLTSNGTIDGLANTVLTSQPVTVTAGVYNLASSSTISPASIITRVGAGGGSVSQALSVQNTAPVGAFSEGLDSSAGTYTSGGGNLTPTVSGTITNLAAGSTDSSTLKATISTATSGTFTGSVAINQASDGATTSGLGITSLGAQSVDLSGKVYQTAVASVTPSVSFGIVHVGDTVSPQTITVTNTASGALVDSIVGSMSVSGAPFSVVGGGTLGSGVTAGNNSGSALQVGLNTSTAGVYTGGNAGSANLSLASHDSDLADVALSTSPVTLNATVNNYAAVGLASTTNGSLTGSGSAYTLNLGTLTQGSNGGSIAAALAALNAALGPADDLTLNSGDFSVISGGGEFGLTLNQVTKLAAGDTQDGALDVSLDTNNTGTFDEVITFDGIGSNASGYSSNANVLDPTLTIEAMVTSGGSGPPTGVPEPSSWLVLLSALAGLGGIRRPWRRTHTGTARAGSARASTA